MRVRTLTIFGRVATIALATALSGCGAGSFSTPTPDRLASHDPSLEPRDARAGLEPPTDAAAIADEPQEVSDPLETMNRKVFEGNQRFNHAVVYPVAKAYHDVVPEPVRNSVENFAGNLMEPLVFANDVLQLRLGAAATTAGRFAINSTVGVGGLFDVATHQHLSRQSGDLGQTFYVWGMHDSPYLVLPLLGPTNVRDVVGATIQFVATIPAGAALVPTQYATAANNLTVAGSVASPITSLSKAGDMKELEESSIDFYSMLRSVANQKRQAELQEAVDSSGWTASGRAAGAPEAPKTSVALLLAVPVPATKEQELVANTFQGGQ
jgi:phospholipid-binding lipoprotein MlaA